MRRRVLLLRHLTLLLVLWGVMGSCGAGNVRPPWGPLPEAVHVDVRVDSDTLLRTIADSLRQQPGIQVTTFRLSEGYLETAWYDTLAQTSSHLRPSRLSHLVRFRFWVDPGDPGTRHVTGEAVRIATFDPSRPTRELERIVPEGHYGGRLVMRILETLREVYGG